MRLTATLAMVLLLSSCLPVHEAGGACAGDGRMVFELRAVGDADMPRAW